MLEILLNAIVEIVFGVVWGAIVKFFALENLVELVTAVLGLSCIAIGLVGWWTGYTP